MISTVFQPNLWCIMCSPPSITQYYSMSTYYKLEVYYLVFNTFLLVAATGSLQNSQDTARGKKCQQFSWLMSNGCQTYVRLRVCTYGLCLVVFIGKGHHRSLEDIRVSFTHIHWRSVGLSEHASGKTANIISWNIFFAQKKKHTRTRQTTLKNRGNKNQLLQYSTTTFFALPICLHHLHPSKLQQLKKLSLGKYWNLISKKNV